MTAILGLSGYYHDSAAALLVDGRIVAAAQEERFSRLKHDHRFPAQAVRFCLDQTGLTESDLDHVVFYEKPLLKFERLLETYLSYAPFGFRSFRKAIPEWLQTKLHLPREIRNGLQKRYQGRMTFVRHHEAHAASAFFASPFHEAAILTMDGVGEWATATIGTGQGNRISLERELRFPHSPGLLYSAMTYYLGFRVNSSEYKVMGLAPYGRPVFRDQILHNLIDLKDDGSFRMDMSYFRFCHSFTMTSRNFDRLFGGPRRKPESPLTQRHKDLAASIQSVTEEIMVRMARHAKAITGMDHLVMAGGVALNCVGNGRILREQLFNNLWIQPAAGDSGGALGAAWFVWHQLLGQQRLPNKSPATDFQEGSLLGPEASQTQIEAVLKDFGLQFEVVRPSQTLYERTAGLLAEQYVVGWFQDRMEFGPRALGARSILADPRSTKMQSVLNQKIKFRESFRPFAPVVLQEHAAENFEWTESQSSPYMLLTTTVKSDSQPIPAVTHVDQSARLQTIAADSPSALRRLLETFHKQTGCPVLVNTSFNVRGEPIVCSPEDAVRCFLATDMDVLVIGDCLVKKSDQTNLPSEHKKQNDRSKFAPD